MEEGKPSTPLPFQDGRIGPFPIRESAGAAQGPLLVGLHGRGSSPERLERFAGPWVAGGRHVLPRAPFAWEGAAAWYLGRPAPEQELRTSVQAVADLLEALWAQGHAPERTLLWGFSQGAMVSLHVSLTLDRRLAGVAAIAAKLHTSVEPNLLARAKGHRYFLIHGRKDPLIPFSDGEATRDRLRAAGADCEWLEHEGLHEVNSRVIASLAAFAARVLRS